MSEVINQHNKIFELINQLKSACQTHFEYENETYKLCPGHKAAHLKLLLAIGDLSNDVKKHVQEFDSGFLTPEQLKL